MAGLACLWNRPRLERHAGRVLGARAARAVAAHLGRCARCRGEAERLSRLQVLLRSTLPESREPDWVGFWPGIQSRIAREAPRPIQDPWWLPLWKPVWGHPRLALGGVLASALAVALSLWPAQEGRLPGAWAAPVVVQDVGTADSRGGVMVYSNPDEDVTLIWVFNPDDNGES